MVAGLGYWMALSLERPLRAIIGLVGSLKSRQFDARVRIKQDGELGALAYHLNLLGAKNSLISATTSSNQLLGISNL